MILTHLCQVHRKEHWAAYMFHTCGRYPPHGFRSVRYNIRAEGLLTIIQRFPTFLEADKRPFGVAETHGLTRLDGTSALIGELYSGRKGLSTR